MMSLDEVFLQRRYPVSFSPSTVLPRLWAVWEEFLCIMDRQDGGKVASEMKLQRCGNEVSISKSKSHSGNLVRRGS